VKSCRPEYRHHRLRWTAHLRRLSDIRVL